MRPASALRLSVIAIAMMLGLILMSLAPSAAHGAVVVWDASSGQTPDQVTPPYTLFNTSGNAPVLSGGMLTLSSSVGANDILGYRHEGAALNVPPDLRIEARVRLDSGGSSQPNRAPAGVQFTTGAGAKNFLWIDQDKIFLNTAGDVRGPEASVDTNDAFHTYRIEVAGTGVGSPVNVFYDNGSIPVLTGTLFAGPGAPEISWGDLSDAVGGTSQWTHFEHNAADVPEPTAAAAAALAGLTVLLSARRGRTCPRA